MIKLLVFFSILAPSLFPAQAAKPMKVLFVMSGVDFVTGKDGRKHKTGYWAEEFVVPYRLLKKAGFKIVIATPRANIPTPDPRSFDVSGWKSADDLAQAKKLIQSEPMLKAPGVLHQFVSEEVLDSYSAVFFPGGHAPMEDLAKDPDAGAILNYFHKRGKPTALVCHGAIALLSAGKGGSWPYKGYRMTVFSNAEEAQSHLSKVLTYSVEDALRKAGAEMKTAKDWAPHVVVDRELITGQNPMSAGPLAEKLLKALGKETND